MKNLDAAKPMDSRKSDAERQKRRRKRENKKGRKGRLLFLTEDEFIKTKHFVSLLRGRKDE